MSRSWEAHVLPPTSIEDRLRTLHEHYTSRVNAAIAAGRMDLVRDLARACEDEALDLIIALEKGKPRRRNHAPIEYLDLGGWPNREGRRRERSWRLPFWRHNR